MFDRLKNLLRGKSEFSSKHPHIDRRLIAITALLVVFGLIMLASASSIVAYNTYQDTYYFFKRQLLSILIGVFVFWVCSKIDYKIFKKLALPMLIASIGILLLVFIPGLGREVNGSQSWLNIFGFSVQPSELVKFSFLAYLAALFEKSSETPKRFISFLLIYGVIALLILLEPDIGTLFVLTAAAFSVYFVGGGKIKHLVILLVVGLLGLYIMVHLPGQEYRLERFKCFIDTGQDSRGSCYQINQSLIAIGSGGIAGRGLGESRQKFLYLPEVQNDFIFAVIAEETGLLGAGAIIILFTFLAFRSWKIAKSAPDGFGRNFCVGISVWIVVQAILNIGGITNFLPMTGVPLPLISYGGTAVIASMAGLGVIANVSRYT